MANKKREKTKRLGRGLQSLLSPITSNATEENQVLPNPAIKPNFPPDKELRGSLQEISIDAIVPNPYQARTVWNEQELEDYRSPGRVGISANCRRTSIPGCQIGFTDYHTSTGSSGNRPAVARVGTN
jgi:hypothetical protein